MGDIARRWVGHGWVGLNTSVRVKLEVLNLHDLGNVQGHVCLTFGNVTHIGRDGLRCQECACRHDEPCRKQEFDLRAAHGLPYAF